MSFAWFLARAVVRKDGCWMWTGSITRHRGGYARTYYQGKKWDAHRLAYTVLIGPIPRELVVDHLCRNPACVNPSHMELVDSRTNTLRGKSPPALNAAQTSCSRGHPLSGCNLYTDKRGRRRCRVCAHRYQWIYRAEHKKSRPASFVGRRGASAPIR